MTSPLGGGLVLPAFVLLGTAFGLPAFFLPGCGNETSITVKCNPGAVQNCTCPGGGFGHQSCGGDEQFGPCSCTPPQGGAGGSGGGGGAGGSNGSDAASDAPTLPTGTLLSS